MKSFIILALVANSAVSFGKTIKCSITSGQLEGSRLTYEFQTDGNVILDDSYQNFDCEQVDTTYINHSAFSMESIHSSVVCEAGFLSSISVFDESKAKGQIIIGEESAADLKCD